MRRPARFLLKLLIFPPLIAAAAGWIVAPWFLHPVRRPLTPDLVQQADVAFSQKHTHREEFDVRASDGSILRGWKVRSPDPSGDWLCSFTASPTIASACLNTLSCCWPPATTW
jgi:hypothetical protein